MSMKKIVSVVAVALLLATGVAIAGEIEGKVQSIDPADRVFVLEDGTKLWVAEGVSMDALKPGAKVKASYEERDGKNITTSFDVTD
jgi:hypothetical protein